MKKYVLEIGDQEYKAELKEITAEYAKIEVDGNQYHVKLKELGRTMASVPIIQSVSAAAPAPAAAPRPSAPKPSSAGAPSGDAESVMAPLPGLILDVFVKEGDTVKAGQDLLVMEAMKMENQVQASHDGTVTKLYVKKGDSVAEGDSLVAIGRSFMSTM